MHNYYILCRHANILACVYTYVLAYVYTHVFNTCNILMHIYIGVTRVYLHIHTLLD